MAGGFGHSEGAGEDLEHERRHAGAGTDESAVGETMKVVIVVLWVVRRGSCDGFREGLVECTEFGRTEDFDVRVVAWVDVPEDGMVVVWRLGHQACWQWPCRPQNVVALGAMVDWSVHWRRNGMTECNDSASGFYDTQEKAWQKGKGMAKAGNGVGESVKEHHGECGRNGRSRSWESVQLHRWVGPRKRESWW